VVPKTVVENQERDEFDRRDVGLVDSMVEEILDGDGQGYQKVATYFVEEGMAERDAWRELFQRWCQSAPEAAWEFARGDYGSKKIRWSTTILEIAIQEWAAIDAEATWRALENPSYSEHTAFIRGVMRSDIELGFQFLTEIDAEGGDQRQLALSPEWLFQLAEIDWQVALKWAEERDDLDLLGAVLAGVIVSDQAGAKQWLNRQVNRDRLLGGLGDFLGYSYAAYRPELMDFAMTMIPSGNRKNVMLQKAIEKLALKDPDLAVAEIERLFKDSHVKAEALAQVADRLKRADFTKAWEIVNRIDPSINSVRRVSIPRAEITKGAETKDGNGPIGYLWDLTSMTGIVSPSMIRSQMLSQLLVVDKEKALSFLAELPDDEILYAGNPMISRWMFYDPVECLKWCAEQVTSEISLESLYEIREYLNLDLSETSELLADLPTGSVRMGFVVALTDELVGDDPEAALSLVHDEGSHPELLQRVYESWAGDDPKAALAEMAEDSFAPPESWGFVVGESFKLDPAHTAEAVNVMPAGESRDVAISAIAKIYRDESDPLAATDWVLGIDEATLRQAKMEEVLQKMAMDLRLLRDPDLRNALELKIRSESNLSDEQEEHWLKRIETEFSN